jgi:hypothetical protein
MTLYEHIMCDVMAITKRRNTSRVAVRTHIGFTALLTKAHSRGRKRLIGRFLNAAKHNGTNERDSDCPNACKDEGSYKQPSLCLRNGSIRISRNGLYSHCLKRRM